MEEYRITEYGFDNIFLYLGLGDSEKYLPLELNQIIELKSLEKITDGCKVLVEGNFFEEGKVESVYLITPDGNYELLYLAEKETETRH